ncbi:MAG TPA: ATP-dependent DNA ligase [Myxococcaceae bacterium]|nr:ATP-dependent DNA ligase [Myxococcaceae bacterium]
MESSPSLPSRETPFAALSTLIRELEHTSSRLEKRRRIAELLRSLDPKEVSPAVLMLVAGIFPEAEAKALNVGHATAHSALEAAGDTLPTSEPLSILEVHRRFEEIALVRGRESVQQRRALLTELFEKCAPSDRQIILSIIFGELRIGVSEGMMLEAIADAAEVSPELVRTAQSFLGNLGKVAEIALRGGAEELQSVALQILSPVKPMLASLATDFDEVLQEHGGQTAAEFKLDGARIQIHRLGDQIRVFTRRLSDVTASVPEVVEVARDLKATSLVVEGETLAVDGQQKPLPFQELMRRFRRIHDVEALRKEIPLRLFLFDLLYLDGESWMARPYRERWDRLERLVPAPLLVSRLVSSDRVQLEAFLQQALRAGHEGLMAKNLESPYQSGKRGKLWFKIKPAETLDMVILAAEWGHGRRAGTLSNYWLGVRDGDQWQMIGKTFKGLTDQQRLDLMERLLEIKTSEDSSVVHVRPELVVEVAYNEIQASPRYSSGYALRFARVVRIREDKGAMDADTYDRLKSLYLRQFERKGKFAAEL